MSVHYKFKSTLDYDTITFDGLHISVADLKKAILQQKRLSKITDFDLQIINAQSKEEYQNDSCLIPKNTSLIISRVPIANQQKKTWDTGVKPVQTRINSKVDGAELDLSKMEGSEEEKIQAMMLQSTADYDPKSYQKIRGYSQTGEVPITYRCNKCKKGGHWIKNCPYNIGKEHSDIKRTTGIPKSFREKDERAMMIENQEAPIVEERNQEVPEDLLCSICNDLFVDAVMIPCCGSSFCDDCVRTALLESEDNECPDCKEKGSSPGSLIPNRFLRNSVNAFKNRTGYKVSQPKKVNLTTESSPVVATITDDGADGDSKKAPVSLEEEKKTESENNSQNAGNSNTDKAEVAEKSQQDTEKDLPSPNDGESDFEDNIVVTMPAVVEGRSDQLYNKKNDTHPKPPGIESSPAHIAQASSLQFPHEASNRSNEIVPPHKESWESNRDCNKREQREQRDKNAESYMFEKSRMIPKTIDSVTTAPANPIYPYQPIEAPQRQIRPLLHPSYHNAMNRAPLFPHPLPHHQVGHMQRMPIPPMNTFENAYSQISTVSTGYPQFPRSNIPTRFAYPMREPPETHSQMHMFDNIASVYQEVAAKVGVGIIDDPLEAFNRIMKEKEKEKKKDERRSPDHRRRRSKDRHQRSTFRSSPYNSRTSKEAAYSERRGRSRDTERRWQRYEKDNDKEREKEKDKFFRQRRSKSFSDKNSRSRSNSPPSRRCRSPSNSRNHISTEKYHQKNRHDEGEDSSYSQRWSRNGNNKSNMQSSKSSEFAFSDKRRDQSDKKMETSSQKSPIQQRKLHHLNEDTSEPPPPGFEMMPTINPFHSNSASSSTKAETKVLRNNTPDLYEKFVSQDLEDNKMYSTSKREHRSRSKSSGRHPEKRRKYSRSTTPKGKPKGESVVMKDKTPDTNDKEAKSRRKSDEPILQKENTEPEIKSRRGSLVSTDKEPLKDAKEYKTFNYNKPTSQNLEMQEGSSEAVENDVKKTDKKLKERKKRRKDRSERKKIKKEKKSKRERNKSKSGEKESVKHHSDTGTSVENKNIESELVFGEGKSSKQQNKIDKESIENTKTSNENEKVGLKHEVSQPYVGDNEKTPTSELKCFDAVLDIHEYETDFDDAIYKTQGHAMKLVPETSKWEIEEQMDSSAVANDDKSEEKQARQESSEKVTSEVLVRAENAIFARAINAIRPMESGKSSSISQKSSKDILPSCSKSYGDSNDSIKNFQITLPVSINKERSVEIKHENSENAKSHKLGRSIKDRLGSKVNRNVFSQVADSYKDDKLHNNKGTSNDHNIHERDLNKKVNDRYKRGIDSKIVNKNHNKNQNEKNSRISNEEHERDRDRDRGRDRDRDRNRDQDRDRGRGRNHDRDRDRDRGRDRERDRDRDRDRDRERERERERENRDRRENKSETTSKTRDAKVQNTSRSERQRTEKAVHDSDNRITQVESSYHHDRLQRKRQHDEKSSTSERKKHLSSDSGSESNEQRRKIAKLDRKPSRRSESLDSEGRKSNKKRNKSSKKKKKSKK